jgi:hypothetical protein
MSICPMCKNDYNVVSEMERVVESAELLIDAAAPDIFSEGAVIAAAAVLKQRVASYRKVVTRIDREEEGEHAVQ